MISLFSNLVIAILIYLFIHFIQCGICVENKVQSIIFFWRCPAHDQVDTCLLDDGDTVAFVSSDSRVCCGRFCTSPPGVSSTKTPGELVSTKLE